ncbi:hypothetical protein [Streptomyces sp. NPDC001678]|uniref:hypothetical protein n=1 Tax=Streptomyces sp. NPDC001678 TaxID=3364599 RepID=UPI0036B64CF3
MNETSALPAALARLAWSPERLAREVNKRSGPGTISSKAPYNWLKGARPRRQLPQLVAEILTDHLGETVTVEELWPEQPTASKSPPGAYGPRTGPAAAPPTAPDPVSATVDWLVAREAEPPVRLSGDEVPAAAVQMLAARLQQLRGLDDSANTRLVMEWALQDLRWVRKLTEEYAYDAPTGVLLHQIAAELGQLAGWLAADMGQEELGTSCFLAALSAARTARDRSLAAYIISCMSYRAAWDRRGDEALRLIRVARMGSAREGGGLDQALLASREARAHAALGDVKGGQRALEEAAGLAEGAGLPDAPWAYWLSPGVMVADAGRAWLEMGHPERAERHLTRGIELLGDDQPRDRLLHWTSLAQARLARREVDGAAAAAGEALVLADRVTSLRADVRLSCLRRRFVRYDSKVARQTVQWTDEMLRRANLGTAC